MAQFVIGVVIGLLSLIWGIPPLRCRRSTSTDEPPLRGVPQAHRSVATEQGPGLDVRAGVGRHHSGPAGRGGRQTLSRLRRWPDPAGAPRRSSPAAGSSLGPPGAEQPGGRRGRPDPDQLLDGAPVALQVGVRDPGRRGGGGADRADGGEQPGSPVGARDRGDDVLAVPDAPVFGPGLDRPTPGARLRSPGRRGRRPAGAGGHPGRGPRSAAGDRPRPRTWR
jgi:hypothetical protein